MQARITNLVNFFIQQSFDGTIVNDGFDLTTIRGAVLNKYDSNLVAHLQKTRFSDDAIYPALLLCFYKALEAVRDIKKCIDEKATSGVKSNFSNDRESLYLFLVKFRPFYLFYVIYNKVIRQEPKSKFGDDKNKQDASDFFETHFGFMLEIGELYDKNIVAMASFFKDERREDKSGWTLNLLKNADSKIVEFYIKFVSVKWGLLLEKAENIIKKAYLKYEKDKTANIIESITDFYAKFKVLMISDRASIDENIKEMMKLTHKENAYNANFMYLMPYFISGKNGYYSSPEIRHGLNETCFVYIKSTADFENGQHLSQNNGILSNLFDVTIIDFFNKKIASDMGMESFARELFRQNTIIDFFILFLENTTVSLGEKEQKIFTAIYNAGFNTKMFEIPTSYAYSDRIIYEFLATQYLIGLINRNAGELGKTLMRIRKTMEEYAKEGRLQDIGIKAFADAMVNGFVSDLKRGFFPINYEYMLGETSNKFDAKKVSYVENISRVIKRLTEVINEQFGVERWDNTPRK